MKQINQFDNAEEFFELPNSWRDKGRKEGREEGLEQGRLAEKEEIVRKSLEENLNVDFISKITGLPVKRILEIKENLTCREDSFIPTYVIQPDIYLMVKHN